MRHQPLSRARAITLLVALATLTSNTLSSLLFAQLPDDPYHLARTFGWYLHFANVGSVFGFIGALRQHPLSISIFSTYLLLDTTLFSIPRFILVSLLHPLSSPLCSTPDPFSLSPAPPPFTIQPRSSEPGSWTPKSCHRLVHLAQIALLAGVLAATLLQFLGALCVRAYARALAERDEASLTESVGMSEVAVQAMSSRS